MTTKFSGENGQVKKLHCVRVDSKIKPVAGTEFELDADLVLLAMGFVHPVHEGMIKALGLELDQRGNVKADTLAYRSSNPKVFAAGDMRRGQSLVVWAITKAASAPTRSTSSDGIDHAAALIREQSGKTQRKMPWKIENGGRGASGQRIRFCCACPGSPAA